MAPSFLRELEEALDVYAPRPALQYAGRSITFGELGTLGARAAAWLQRNGAVPGDRVALFTDEKLSFLIAQLGATLMGAVPVPLNPRFTREEMRYFLGDSGARVVVAGDAQRELLEPLRKDLPALGAVLPSRSVESLPDAPWSRPAVSSDDPCLIIYSSGTTGWPKGVVHTHGNAARSLHSLAACWRMSSDDVVLNVLPLFHIHGLAFATHMTWLTGGCVRVEEGFDVSDTLDAARACTVVMAVPTIYYKWLEAEGFQKSVGTWDRVRLFTCGSAPIRADVLPRLQGILGRPVINRYGMSEAYVITSLPLDGPWPYGSVGRPVDGIELRVVREDGEPCSAGEVGAVRIKGLNLFREYWGKPDATAASVVSGWFDTGDVGTLDGDGFLTLVGRKNDLIITNGYNVYPQVVERVVNECPGIKESAVVGLPDAQRGERVVAAVICDDPAMSEERLRRWMLDRLVAYQQPKDIYFVEALPRNNLGKVLRRELREQLTGARSDR